MSLVAQRGFMVWGLVVVLQYEFGRTEGIYTYGEFHFLLLELRVEIVVELK